MRPGRYLAIEGIDGAGKTTVGRLLADQLSGRGVRCHLTHDPEPHGLSEMVLQLWCGSLRLSRPVWPLLFAASSIESQQRQGGHLEHLLDGAWVVTDRCALSTIAYFLDDDTHGVSWLIDLHREYVVPDVVVFLDLDPAVATNRVAERDGEPADLEGARGFRHRYRLAASACRSLGWTIVNRRIEPEDSAQQVAASILCLLDDRWPESRQQ